MTSRRPTTQPEESIMKDIEASSCSTTQGESSKVDVSNPGNTASNSLNPLNSSPNNGGEKGEEESGSTAPTGADAKPKPRRIIRRRNRRRDQAPAVDPVLLEQVVKSSGLPSAYSFEIVKTVQRIQGLQASHIALQLPEGLLMYSTVLSDILKRLTSPLLQQVSILGDVTYGACCVDDLGAQALGAQLLVHYGHSCLVPLSHTVIPCLYVFVEISIDIPHLVDCVDLTLRNRYGDTSSSGAVTSSRDAVTTSQALAITTAPANAPLIYLLGTIQFRHSLMQAQDQLRAKGYSTLIPQAKPLSPGEVLGCTSPALATGENGNEKVHAVVCFVADGRFHLESTLIANPHIPTFIRYDPYGKTLTDEKYDHERMHTLRQTAIKQAKSANTFGLLLGTLGRQGNPAILKRLQAALRKHNKRSVIILLSEISPHKLYLFNANNHANIDAWVQVACPRLSVDWGHMLSSSSSPKPVLNPYELMVCLEETQWKSVYPMDYYANAGGPWANYFEDNKERQMALTAAPAS